MRLPAPRGDLDVLAVSFPETMSVRDETEVGHEAATTLILVGGEWWAVEFRTARPLDENRFRMEPLIISLFDSRWCSWGDMTAMSKLCVCYR
jgi:hypothetical protein